MKVANMILPGQNTCRSETKGKKKVQGRRKKKMASHDDRGEKGEEVGKTR